MSGARQRNRIFRTRAMGSPPHIRGLRPSFGHCSNSLGFIPAYPGSVCWSQLRMLIGRVHPRRSGVSRDHGFIPWDDVGSPPLSRGQQISRLTLSVSPGFIPVSPGSALARLFKSELEMVHPRSPWGRPAEGYIVEIRSGSSPCNRGQRQGPTFDIAGFIPVHPGRTPALRVCAPMELGDH